MDVVVTIAGKFPIYFFCQPQTYFSITDENVWQIFECLLNWYTDDMHAKWMNAKIDSDGHYARFRCSTSVISALVKNGLCVSRKPAAVRWAISIPKKCKSSHKIPKKNSNRNCWNWKKKKQNKKQLLPCYEREFNVKLNYCV